MHRKPRRHRQIPIDYIDKDNDSAAIGARPWAEGLFNTGPFRSGMPPGGTPFKRGQNKQRPYNDQHSLPEIFMAKRPRLAERLG